MSNIVYSLEQIHKASVFLTEVSTSKLFCFQGDLGAGKTTLIKAILKDLGASDAGSSPTYGLVQEYHSPKGELLAFHLDCYRLKGVEEALDMGIEEYLYAGCYIFIEWPERIASLLPIPRTEVHLETLDPFCRRLMVKTIS